MKDKTFLILGGYGSTGKLISRLLLAHTDLKIIIAGRNLSKAIQTAEELNRTYGTHRAAGRKVDASSIESVRAALIDCGFVLAASSTSKYALNVASAAVESGADYLDVQFSSKKITALRSLEKEIHSNKRCFITDGGFHPGLPAALVRFASSKFDRITHANVSSLIKMNWAGYEISESTAKEFIEEISDFAPMVFKDNAWQRMSLWKNSTYKKIDFGEPFGVQLTYPMMLEELYKLPELYPSLKEIGFYLTGFNWVVDYLLFPLAAILSKIFPYAVNYYGKMLSWGLKKFSKPPFGILMKLEAEGFVKGETKKFTLSLSHADGYMFTAIPVAGCILQYLEAKEKPAGLHTMAHFVDPERLISDMKRMGIDIKF